MKTAELQTIRRCQDEALNVLYVGQHRLRSQLIHLPQDGAIRRQAERVLALARQQVGSGRADHARSERMLECYREMRATLTRSPPQPLPRAARGHFEVAQQQGILVATAMHLGSLMLLTGTSVQDTYRYSMAWHTTLSNLHNALYDLALRSIDPEQSQASPVAAPPDGFFVPPQNDSQNAQLAELLGDKHFEVLPLATSAGIRVALGELLLVAIWPDGTRRDVDLSGLVTQVDMLPAQARTLRVSEGQGAPTFAYIDRAGTSRELVYDGGAEQYTLRGAAALSST